MWVRVHTAIASSVSLNGSTPLEYDLSSYLPDDSYNYEILIGGSLVTGTTAGYYGYYTIGSDITIDTDGGYLAVAYAITRTSSSMYAGGTILLPISTSRKVYISRNTNYHATVTVWLEAYRRIGTNS